MKLGDLIREGWSRERLAAEGWVPIGEYPRREFVRAGFRLRSHEAEVYAPGWLVAVRTVHRVQTINAREYAQVLARLRDEVERRNPEELEVAYRLGGPEAVRGVLAAWEILK